MRISTSSAIGLLLLLICTICACGGGGGETSTAKAEPLQPTLPAPEELDSLADSLERSSSQETSVDLTAPVSHSTSAFFEAAEGNALLSASIGNFCYALYQVNAPSPTHAPGPLNLQLDPEIGTETLFIGIADYQNGIWATRTFENPGETVSVDWGEGAYYSVGGHMYFFIAVFDDDSARITEAIWLEKPDVWQSSVGGPGFDGLVALTVDSSGRRYSLFEPDTLTDPEQGMLVSCHSAEGELLWLRQLFKNDCDYRGTSIVVDESGNVVITAESRPEGTTEPGISLITLSSQGDLLAHDDFRKEGYGFIPKSLAVSGGQTFIGGVMGEAEDQTPRSYLYHANAQFFGLDTSYDEEGEAQFSSLEYLLASSFEGQHELKLGGATGEDPQPWVGRMSFSEATQAEFDAVRFLDDPDYEWELESIWADSSGSTYALSNAVSKDALNPVTNTYVHKLSLTAGISYSWSYGGEQRVTYGADLSGNDSELYVTGWSAEFGAPVYEGMLLKLRRLNGDLLSAGTLKHFSQNAGTFLTDIDVTVDGLTMGGFSDSASTDEHATHFWDIVEEDINRRISDPEPQLDDLLLSVDYLPFTELDASAGGILAVDAIGSLTVNSGGGDYDGLIAVRR